MKEGDIPLRRRPQQARSKQRFNQILDAATQEFTLVGYEAATTNAIAERANVSIGSLYQFFPNKEAILHAVAMRYLEELRALKRELFGPHLLTLPLTEIIERIVDSLVEFHVTNPGCNTIFFGSLTTNELAAASEGLQEETTGRIEELLALRIPGLGDSQRRLYATVSSDITRTLLIQAELCEEPLRSQIIAETKRLLLAYLEPVFQEGGAL